MKLLASLLLVGGLVFFAAKYVRDKNAEPGADAKSMTAKSAGESTDLNALPADQVLITNSQTSGRPNSNAPGTAGATTASAPRLYRTKSTGAGGITLAQLGTGESRKFTITISRARGNKSGAVVASGGFYDVDSDVTTSPETLPINERKWTQCGQIAVFGISGAIDAQQWKGWLERDSANATILEGSNTLPGYRVVGAPIAKAAATPAPPGSWMNKKGTTLGQPGTPQPSTALGHSGTSQPSKALGQPASLSR